MVLRKITKVSNLVASAKLTQSGVDTFMNYKYFTLNDICPWINKFSEEVGLGLAFKNTIEEVTHEHMLTLVVHDKEDGETMEFPFFLVDHSVFTSAQGKVSPIQAFDDDLTYTRRYILMNVFNIAETDDFVEKLNEKEAQEDFMEKNQILSDLYSKGIQKSLVLFVFKVTDIYQIKKEDLIKYRNTIFSYTKEQIKNYIKETTLEMQAVVNENTPTPAPLENNQPSVQVVQNVAPTAPGVQEQKVNKPSRGVSGPLPSYSNPYDGFIPM